MVDTNEEWNETYGGYKVIKQYRPLTHEQEEAGLTATIVTASWRMWTPGLNCPSGHVFDDKSRVEATSVPPRLLKDVSEMAKDDEERAKDLEGTEAQENAWHAQVRGDLDKAPDPNWYKENKWYINPLWDLEQQLELKEKKKVPKRIKKSDRGEGPDWLDKAYGRK